MSGRVTRETLYGQVIYPEKLPRKRGNRTTISTIYLLTIMIAISLYAGGSDYYGANTSVFVTFVCFLCLLVIAHLLWRLMYYMEERHHIESRYKGSHWYLLTKLLYFTWPSRIYILFCFVCSTCMFMVGCDIKYHYQNISWVQICAIVIIGVVLQIFVKLVKNPVYDSVFLESLHRLDYGSGMAQNFFHGYLRLVLPYTGDQEKGIEERIDDFIAKQRLPPDSFPVKKLFVLIPSSTYVPDDLKECSFGWMESSGTLEKLVRDRAGVKSRPYKNSVYRIKNPDDFNDKGIYVVAEGATPCKTLHEVVQFSGARQEFYKEHQKEIVYNFYETLRETLRDDRKCRGLCEFIYYDDTDEFGLNNVNVAMLIQQRIREIQQNEEILRDVRDRNI